MCCAHADNGAKCSHTTPQVNMEPINPSVWYSMIQRSSQKTARLGKSGGTRTRVGSVKLFG